MKTVRYHIQLASHRTTVSLERTISDLMAIKLGTKPGTVEAHKVVRAQIDTFIAQDRGRSGVRIGHYIAKQAALFISDKTLSEKYWDGIFADLDKEVQNEK